MKHTPGPWKFDADGDYVWGPNQEMIAEIRGIGAGLPMLDNARLITAAPEMLEALKEMSWYVSHIMGEKKRVDWGNTFDMDWGRINSALLLLDRTIAKAEGKLK